MGKLKPINPTKAQIVVNPQAAAHDYDNLTHKPQINGHELVGNKTGDELGLQGKLTAGENVTIDANGRISATGGTDDYEELTNKPQINGVELIGYKTSRDLGLINQIISSATVNQNGTITFTMSDGSTVTTTGESVIGPQGPAGADGQQGPAGADWVPTETELNDIAQRAVNLIPTTQGVLYGNTSN